MYYIKMKKITKFDESEMMWNVVEKQRTLTQLYTFQTHNHTHTHWNEENTNKNLGSDLWKQQNEGETLIDLNYIHFRTLVHSFEIIIPFCFFFVCHSVKVSMNE